MSSARSSAARTQEEIIDSCITLRREWLDSLGNQTHALNGVDVFALGLALLFFKANRLRIGDQDAATRLATLFDKSSLSNVEILFSDEGSPCLSLMDGLDPNPMLIVSSCPRIFYNCGTRIELARVNKPLETDLRLIPFSSLSPALWRCGLVWCEPSDGKNNELPAPLSDIRRLLTADWIDPLKLYEEVQTQRDRLKYQTARRTDGDFVAEDVEALKARIAELELSGLVRHRDLVAKAALGQRSRR